MAHYPFPQPPILDARRGLTTNHPSTSKADQSRSASRPSQTREEVGRAPPSNDQRIETQAVRDPASRTSYQGRAPPTTSSPTSNQYQDPQSSPNARYTGISPDDTEMPPRPPLGRRSDAKRPPESSFLENSPTSGSPNAHALVDRQVSTQTLNRAPSNRRPTPISVDEAIRPQKEPYPFPGTHSVGQSHHNHAHQESRRERFHPYDSPQPPRSPTAELLNPWFDFVMNPFDMTSSGGSSALMQNTVNASDASILSSLEALKGSTGHVVYPIVEFAAQVLRLGHRPKERIVEFRRKKEQTSVGHEFLIVTIETAQQSRVYVRLDRRPVHDPHRPSMFLISSKVPASDSAVLASDLEALRATPGEVIETESHVKFPTPDPGYESGGPVPTLYDLAELLSIIEEVSPRYDLKKENCWFFASILEETMTRLFDGTYKKGHLGHVKIGGDKRIRIFERMKDRVASRRPRAGSGSSTYSVKR